MLSYGLRLAAACLVVSAAAARLAGQESAPVPGDAPAGAPPAAEAGPPLGDEQAAIQNRFDRFEDTLLKMAQYLQKTEPARAELVMRALSKSRSERVAERMKGISGMLDKENGKSPRYADAIAEQDAILADLREILTILRSEDILDENRKEQERLKELAKQVSALIDAEKVHQADTQRGEPTDRVAKGQQKTAEKTGEIVQKVQDHDRAAGENKSGERQDGSEDRKDENGGEKNRDGDKESRDGDEKKDGENEKEGNKSGEPEEGEQAKEGEKGSDQSESGENKSGESKGGEQSRQNPSGQDSQGEQSKGGQNQQNQQGEQGEPQEGQPQDGQRQGDQERQGGESKNPPRPTPGREDLEAAKQRMEKAIEELKKQNRENATKEQEEAIKKLIAAKEKIEELLRQLREEERELLLRGLEARFQKMLQTQQRVLESTEILKSLPNDKWQDREFARCRDAASLEREILIEADKALEVLRSDGSSVAFPEAVEEIRTDVADVAGRLGREEAGELTVAIEKEIIEALQEMIVAFQKEMQKIREQKGQPGQQGQPDDPSLVDKLAELKMLKTLQLRVNRRTKTLGQMFEGEQATAPDIAAQLRELAERQGRLQRATYDLATGRTAN